MGRISFGISIGKCRYLGDESSEPPRGKTSVIFANALGGENRNLSNQRVWADRTLRLAKESGLQDEETFLDEMTKDFPKLMKIPCQVN